MNYFSNLDTVDEIKKVYRSLAFEHHPDRGGDHATMQTINRQYHEALKRCDNQRSRGDAGKEHIYRYDEKLEQSTIEAIYKLIALQMDNVKIALIGTWVWVTGDTKPHKEELKAIGCRWHSQRECWYYTATPYKGRYSNSGLSSLAAKYGYADVTELRRKAERIAN